MAKLDLREKINNKEIIKEIVRVYVTAGRWGKIF